ncbi:thioesterase [Aliikangiella marina]|uniref:Thioesterase n=1 Tax=Aliikangiella marina TaxID=1712262 RepID=A0A545TJJ9_9GAMM|nr:alpha/beta fold hydrolase [Aliikangiella marina]TQV77388.1 thioesterase [Aliikangiella marina]
MVTRGENETPWMVIHKPNPSATMRLICFHYGGGSASAYRDWPRLLPANVELCAVQLPGREKRFNEKYITEFPELTEKLCDELKAFLTKPYVVFGHSLGAMVSFEWLRVLQQSNLMLPLLYIPSGMPAPQLYYPNKPIGELPEDEFVNELLLTYGDNLGNVLRDKDLRSVFMPQLRGDFKLLESYQFKEASVLDCQIHALAGDEEENIGDADLAAWGVHTQNSFSSKRFNGGHFFVHTDEQKLLSFISKELNALMGTQKTQVPEFA